MSQVLFWEGTECRGTLTILVESVLAKQLLAVVDSLMCVGQSEVFCVELSLWCAKTWFWW